MTGSHTITLRKEGYQSKSYTIYLYNDGEDITYSFPELEKIEKEENNKIEDKNSGGTVSGNDSISNDKNSDETVSGNDNSTDGDEESQVSGNDSVDRDKKGSDPDSDILSGEGDNTENESEGNQSTEDTSIKKESIFVRIGRYISELFR